MDSLASPFSESKDLVLARAAMLPPKHKVPRLRSG
jgi:hypothetical protein